MMIFKLIDGDSALRSIACKQKTFEKELEMDLPLI